MHDFRPMRRMISEPAVRDHAVLPHLAIPTTLSAAEFSGAAGYSAADTREKVGPSAPATNPTPTTPRRATSA